MAEAQHARPGDVRADLGTHDRQTPPDAEGKRDAQRQEDHRRTIDQLDRRRVQTVQSADARAEDHRPSAEIRQGPAQGAARDLNVPDLQAAKREEHRRWQRSPDFRQELQALRDQSRNADHPRAPAEPRARGEAGAAHTSGESRAPDANQHGKQLTSLDRRVTTLQRDRDGGESIDTPGSRSAGSDASMSPGARAELNRRLDDDRPEAARLSGEVKTLERVAEHRLRRDDSGLATHIDDEPVAEYLRGVMEVRASLYRDNVGDGYSRRDLGAVVSCVLDRRTGEIVEAANGRPDEVIRQDDVHPTLAARVSPTRPHAHPDEPFGHAEVKSANQLLHRRTDLGLPDDGRALAEMRVDAFFPFGVKGQRPAPMCANCDRTLREASSNSGRFESYPPDESRFRKE